MEPKTAVQWYTLTDPSRIALLACLTPEQCAAQAAVIAADRDCTTCEVLSVWRTLGYLPAATVHARRKVAA